MAASEAVVVISGVYILYKQLKKVEREDPKAIHTHLAFEYLTDYIKVRHQYSIRFIDVNDQLRRKAL